MTGTTSTINLSALPDAIGIKVNGFEVIAPALLTKPDPEKPTKPQGIWYTAKQRVPMTSGNTAESVLGSVSVSFAGQSLKAGKVHTSEVNEERGTGGNPTVTHSLVADLGEDKVPYQIQVTLTALSKKDGEFIQVWVKAFRRPASNGSKPVGSIVGDASF